MGFRFRKSKKIGPVRITLSKSGIGCSVGVKGLRFTKKAGGGTRTTASIPGTGISYVTDSSGRRKESALASCYTSPELMPAGSGDDRVTLAEVLLAWLLGWAGGHKFYRRKFGMGILYFFTFGFFCIGWFGDALWLTLRFVTHPLGTEPPKAARIPLFVAAVLILALIGSCQSGSGTQAAPEKPLKDLTKSSSATAIISESTAPTEEPSEFAVETGSETSVPAEAETTEPEETTDNIVAPAVLPFVPETSAPTTDAVAEVTEPEIAEAATIEPPAETTVPETTKPEVPQMEYVLNTNTMRFHYPKCKSVKQIKDSNKDFFTGTREDIVAKGYKPCGNCHP